MNITKQLKTLSNALITSALVLLAPQSLATLTSSETLMSASFSGENDCSNGFFHEDGYKGYTGFSACRIAIEDTNGVTIKLSDVIAKFDTGTSLTPTYTESKQFEDDVQQSDWQFGKDTNTPDSGDLTDAYKQGNWNYGNTFPGIRFWTAKASNGFNLFWVVDKDTDGTSPDACDPNSFTLGCLNLAKTVTSGSWTTPAKDNGQLRGLSHITFFGGIGTTPPCDPSAPGCGSTSVPEPKTIMIFALALLALVVRQKRLALFKP